MRVGFTARPLQLMRTAISGAASSISEGDIFIYSCSGQLSSFEIDLISKELNCAEQIYEYVPLTYRAGDATDNNTDFWLVLLHIYCIENRE